MPAERVSVDEAKPEKLFYFVVTGVVYRPSDGRCLILKRDKREKVHPGKWSTVGGKLEHADLNLAHPTKVDGEVAEFKQALPELLKRETKEEAGVDISDTIHPLGVPFPFVRPDGIPVVMASYAVEYTGGEVVPEPGAFSEFAWVNQAEIASYDCIEGVKAEVEQTIQLLHS